MCVSLKMEILENACVTVFMVKGAVFSNIRVSLAGVASGQRWSVQSVDSELLARKEVQSFAPSQATGERPKSSREKKTGRRGG